MKRKLLFLIPICIVSFILLGRLGIGMYITKELHNRNWKWVSCEQKFLSMHCNELRKSGFSIKRLDLTYRAKTLFLALNGVELTLKSDQLPTSPNSSANPKLPIPLVVTVKDLNIHHHYLPPIQHLHGDLHPNLNVQNQQLQILRTKSGKLQITGKLHGSWEFAEATLHFSLLPQANQFKVSTDNLIIDHPLLAPQKLSIPLSTVTGTWQNKQLTATATIDKETFKVHGTLQPKPFEFDLQLESTDLQLRSLVKWWGIDEAKRLTIDGNLHATLQLKGPPVEWNVDVQPRNLKTKGTLFNPLAFSRGFIPYQPRNASKRLLFGPASSTWTPSKRFGWLEKALIAAEDGQFWQHSGYDMSAIREAIQQYQKSNKKLRGGSTISQQLAKNLFTGPQRTLQRKLRELLYTLELERNLGKKRILELYLNIVEFGPDIYGVQEAADKFFVKSPQNLTVKEAAYLVSVLPAPQYYYNRLLRGRPSTWKIDIILQRMRKRRDLSEQQYQQAKQSKLIIIPPTP